MYFTHGIGFFLAAVHSTSTTVAMTTSTTLNQQTHPSSTPIPTPVPQMADNPGVTFGVPVGVSAIIILSVILGARIWIKKRKRRIKRMQKNAIRLRTSNVYSISRTRTPSSSTIFNVFFEYLALLEVPADTVELSKNHS